MDSDKFPDMDSSESQYTVIHEDTPIPAYSHAFNIGAGRVICMNEAAWKEYGQNQEALDAKVNPTGVVADIPFTS